MPAAVLGLLIGSHVQRLLFSPGPVAVALVVGGIAILWAERRPVQVKAERAEQISRIDALKIGFVQCLALWPGTSRSGATIIGGLWFGASRQAATEFSFFLGIPILGPPRYTTSSSTGAHCRATTSAFLQWVSLLLSHCAACDTPSDALFDRTWIWSFCVVSHCTGNANLGSGRHVTFHWR